MTKELSPLDLDLINSTVVDIVTLASFYGVDLENLNDYGQ